MATYSYLVDMHMVYGDAAGNGQLSQRLYQGRFPKSRCSYHSSFARIKRWLRNSWSFNWGDWVFPCNILRQRTKPPCVFCRNGRSAVVVYRLVDYLYATGFSWTGFFAHVSVESSTQWTGASFSHTEGASTRRKWLFSSAEICTLVNGYNEEWSKFTFKIVFTEEATFILDGMVNMHHAHIWSTENHHAVISWSTLHHRFSVII